MDFEGNKKKSKGGRPKGSDNKKKRVQNGVQIWLDAPTLEEFSALKTKFPAKSFNYMYTFFLLEW